MRALHQKSGRSGPFVSVNVSAIPPGTATSALFGHVQGAFTGATRSSQGFFAAADGGTLFLDEVGETALEVQSTLLRAVETGEVQPVGSPTTRTVDVRLIAATDSNLEAAAARGSFRLPLLHRLGVARVEVPPLRARKEDIGRLLIAFLRDALVTDGAEHRLTPPQGRAAPWLSAPLIAALCRYNWPGNVREPRSLAIHIAITSGHLPEVDASQVLERLRRPAADGGDALGVGRGRGPRSRQRGPRRLLDSYTEDEVRQALARSRHQPGAAARLMGISRTTMYVSELCGGLARRCGGQNAAGALEKADGHRDTGNRSGRVRRLLPGAQPRHGLRRAPRGRGELPRAAGPGPDHRLLRRPGHRRRPGHISL